MSTIMSEIEIRDVTLRDGAQSLANPIDPFNRAVVAALLLASGIPEIEVGGFGRLAQHQGVEEVIGLLSPQYLQRLSGYTPNKKGVLRAADAGLTRFNLHTATADGYTIPLLGVDAQTARIKLAEAAETVRGLGGVSTAYVSGVDQDPNGPVSPNRVSDTTKFVLDEGIARVFASDTTGMATADSMSVWLEAMLDAAEGESERIGLHLHNKSGKAIGLAVLAATRFGITHFDGSLTGLGRCPAETSGTNGNIATEQLVYAFEGQAFTTGVDLSGINLAVLAANKHLISS